MIGQPPNRERIIDAFHHFYYDHPENTWDNTYWLGVPTQKCPLDLRIYQEILYELRPDVIIESAAPAKAVAPSSSHQSAT